ncbi:hypothetical protein [Actinomadura sp. SCN-SB]|uniref:hypothetical protein n=1 Tax=Actinomadura sp. SCN-SB TaxID=3373092 RepID=UPI0037507B1F
MRSDSYTLPGQERRDHPDLTAFASYTGIEGHARLARGRWPRAAGGGEVEAALPSAAAQWIRVGVGDVLTLRGRIDTDDVVRVRVVGLFDATRPEEYFWQGDRLITTGADVRWTVLPDLRHVDAGEIGPLGDRAARGSAAFQGAGGGGQVTVVTSLPELADEVGEAVQVAWHRGPGHARPCPAGAGERPCRCLAGTRGGPG